MNRTERRLIRAAEALPPADPAPAGQLAEAGMLAREATEALRIRLEAYRRYAEEAGAKPESITDSAPADHVERIESCPPERVTFSDLERLGRVDPARMQRRFDDIKQAARDELRCGERAARAIEGPFPSCWERARFLALRGELLDAWQPRDAQERMIVDQLAQAQTMIWLWQETERGLLELQKHRTRRALSQEEEYQTPRLSEAETLARAAAQVDRYQRLYERNVRLLLLGRRRPLAIRMGKVKQVNINGR